MVPVDFEHFCVAVWVDGVVGEADLVPLPGGVHHELVVEVEEEGAHVLVVDLTTTVSLLLQKKTRKKPRLTKTSHGGSGE